MLKAELDKLLQIGLIQGRNPRVLVRDFQKRFQVSRSDAERLMITELRRVQTEAAKQSYLRNGNTEYEFWVVGPKPCPTCQGLNGKVFPVKDMAPGENAPPIHPRCHCATAPYWDQEAFDRWLEEENQRMHERMEEETVASGGKRGILTEKDKRGILDYMSSGVSYALNDALRSGRALTDAQYDAYTSAGTEVYDETMDIQLVIQSKTARDMREYNPLEQEVLFKCGAWFIVIKKEGKKIWMEEL